MRRAQVAKGSQPVRNLAGNPAFLTTSTPLTLRTNLCANPSGEAASGTVTTRTNLATDPRATNTTVITGQAGWRGTRWFGPAPAAGAYSLVTGAADGPVAGLGTYLRKTWTADAANSPGDSGFENTQGTSTNPGAGLAVTAGTTYTISSYLRSSAAGKTNANINLFWKDAATNWISSVASAPVAMTAGQWLRVSVTATAPAGAVSVGIVSDVDAGSFWLTGDTLDGTGLLIEATNALLPYFDGSIPAAENIVKTAATALSNVTITTGVSYAGSTWSRAAVAVGSGTAIARQYVALADLVSGDYYTVAVTVANDQAFSQQVSLDWGDLNYSVFTLAPGEVRRIVSGGAKAYDATYRFSDMEVTRSATEGRSILYKDWLVEKGNTPGDYYAGTGDYTYVWTGTANASASTQKGTGVGNWTLASLAQAFQSSTQKNSLGKSIGIITRGGNGDGAYAADVTGIVPGTSYTLSGWVKTTSSVPISTVLRFKDAGNATLNDATAAVTPTVGVWTRISATGVAPASSALLQSMFRVLAAHTGTVFFIDDILIESSPVLGSYFDGATPAAGDFSYAWTGTANASPSNQTALNISTIIANRNTAILDSKFFYYSSTAEDGKKTVKWLSPMGTPSSTWRIAAIGGNSSNGWTYGPVKAGGRYTLFMRYRSSGWGAGQTFQIMIADGGTQNQVIPYDTSQPLNALGWAEYRRSFTALLDATTASTIYVSLPALPQVATDGVFEIREWMLVEGDYTGDFIDGSKPFSKWDGTANLSTSVGYPQQLLDLAGPPLLDYTAAGTYTLDNSFGLTEGRTFYTVFENFTDLAALSPIAQYGDTALSDTVPNTYIQLRQDPYAGAGNQLFQRRTGAQGNTSFGITNARQVACWGVNSSGVLTMAVNGGALGTDPTAQVMSLPHLKLLIQSDDSLHKHFRTIMYRGAHDTTTRTAISRYLGNKYGALVA